MRRQEYGQAMAAKAAQSRGRSRLNYDPLARHENSDIDATTIVLAKACHRHKGEN